MDAPHSQQTASQVFSPANFQELFGAWARFPGAVPYAGGTALLRSQGKRVPTLPQNILSLENLEDLHRITRTERYLEIGAMVTLSQILRLGKIVPEALTRCLENIAGPQLRNLATIGGNICHPAFRLDASAPMIALDAHYELRSAAAGIHTNAATQSRWISAPRFSALPGPPALAPQELLTRIRIPLDQWNYSLFRKLAIPGIEDAGGVIVFLIRNQKNILTDIRIVFAGEVVLQDRSTESLLAGKKLPLERRDAENFIDRWKTYLSALEHPGEFIKAGILNFIRSGLAVIVD
ncbi:FAD-binding protein [Spirochaetia bacterium]|nr:FAD-binding protein [Spirochaetia bacterium]